MLTYIEYAKYRDAAGLTDYKVSQQTGVAVSTIAAWKAGKYQPKLERLIKICDLCGIPRIKVVE